MRTPSMLFALVALAVAPLRAADIVYGHPRELSGVDAVFVWQCDPASVREKVLAELNTTVPALVIGETEAASDVTYVVKRRSSHNAETYEELFVTSGLVVRSLGPERARILMESISTAKDETEAVREVTQEFIAELQRANGEKYGKAPPIDYSKPPRPRFRTTAGLRVGMSKKAVREAVGNPTRLDGRATATQVWWYETTDGTTRVIFRADTIMAIRFVATK